MVLIQLRADREDPDQWSVLRSGGDFDINLGDKVNLNLDHAWMQKLCRIAEWYKEYHDTGEEQAVVTIKCDSPPTFHEGDGNKSNA